MFTQPAVPSLFLLRAYDEYEGEYEDRKEHEIVCKLFSSAQSAIDFVNRFTGRTVHGEHDVQLKYMKFVDFQKKNEERVEAEISNLESRNFREEVTVRENELRGPRVQTLTEKVTALREKYLNFRSELAKLEVAHETHMRNRDLLNAQLRVSSCSTTLSNLERELNILSNNTLFMDYVERRIAESVKGAQDELVCRKQALKSYKNVPPFEEYRKRHVTVTFEKKDIRFELHEFTTFETNGVRVDLDAYSTKV